MRAQDGARLLKGQGASLSVHFVGHFDPELQPRAHRALVLKAGVARSMNLADAPETVLLLP
jgi:predicted metal-dependent phosphotriesterase family hydrolase